MASKGQVVKAGRALEKPKSVVAKLILEESAARLAQPHVPSRARLSEVAVQPSCLTTTMYEMTELVGRRSCGFAGGFDSG